jgi:hypothetical protein
VQHASVESWFHHDSASFSLWEHALAYLMLQCFFFCARLSPPRAVRALHACNMSGRSGWAKNTHPLHVFMSLITAALIVTMPHERCHAGFPPLYLYMFKQRKKVLGSSRPSGPSLAAEKLKAN